MLTKKIILATDFPNESPMRQVDVLAYRAKL